jgi:hypothetical protein
VINGNPFSINGIAVSMIAIILLALMQIEDINALHANQVCRQHAQTWTAHRTDGHLLNSQAKERQFL